MKCRRPTIPAPPPLKRKTQHQQACQRHQNRRTGAAGQISTKSETQGAVERSAVLDGERWRASAAPTGEPKPLCCMARQAVGEVQARKLELKLRGAAGRASAGAFETKCETVGGSGICAAQISIGARSEAGGYLQFANRFESVTEIPQGCRCRQ